MTLLDKSVSKNEAGTWDFQCPGPVDDPCGTVREGGPGFRSSGWPTKKVALSRGEQHFAEHKGEGPAMDMHEFMALHSLQVTPAGDVVRVEDLG